MDFIMAEPQTKCSVGCPGSDICVDCIELRHLAHQLAEAQELTRMVRNQIASVKSRINARTDPVTRKLPVEVICRIFELYADLDFVEEQMTAGVWPTGRDTSPLTIGAVCRRWRDIAWSFPILWTALALDVDCKVPAWGPELVHQWLERAAGQPLAIQFSNLTGSDSADSGYCAIIDILNQFSAQWKILDLSGLPYELLERIDDDKYLNPTSQLTHICVAETGFPGPRPGMLSISRQHRPTFVSFVSDSYPITLHIDWRNVSRIHVARSMTSLMSILPLAAASPSLREMTIYSLRDDYGPIRSTERVVQLKILQTLSIEGSGSGVTSPGNIFDSMTLPSLQTFHLDSNWRRSTDIPVPSIPRISRLFSRSKCPLLHLSLLKLSLYPIGLLSLLRCVPSLRTLQLSYVHNAEKLFGNLSEVRLRNDIQPFLPSLTSLDIAAYETDAWRPLADIWDNIPHRLRFSGHQPTLEQDLFRKNLSVKIKLVCIDQVQPEYYMDRYMLKWMVSLWERRGIVVPIEYVTRRGRSIGLPDANFYEQSYEYHCSGDWEDEKLHQSLMAMLSTLAWRRS